MTYVLEYRRLGWCVGRVLHRPGGPDGCAGNGMDRRCCRCVACWRDQGDRDQLRADGRDAWIASSRKRLRRSCLTRCWAIALVLLPLLSGCPVATVVQGGDTVASAYLSYEAQQEASRLSESLRSIISCDALDDPKWSEALIAAADPDDLRWLTKYRELYQARC